MSQSFAKMLILVGATAFIIGVIFYFFGDKLNWLGKLPGDIRIQKENFSFYFPFTTCILISILVWVILRIVQWMR